MKISWANAGLALAAVCGGLLLAACFALPLKVLGAHPFQGLLLSCGIAFGVASYVGRVTLRSMGTMVLLAVATLVPTLLLAWLVDSSLTAYAVFLCATCLLVHLFVASVFFRAEIPLPLRTSHPALSSILAEAMLIARVTPGIVGTEVEVPVLIFFGGIFAVVTSLVLLVPFSVILHRWQTAPLRISASSST
jgi:hypothetical protein